MFQSHLGLEKTVLRKDRLCIRVRSAEDSAYIQVSVEKTQIIRLYVAGLAGCQLPSPLLVYLLFFALNGE